MQIHKLILGTAQFGLDYGINNKRGKIPREEVFEILDDALSHGVDTLDTAQAYGESEAIIGEFIKTQDSSRRFKVITKINAQTEKEVDWLVGSSIGKLCLESLYGCLIHSFKEYLSNPVVFRELEELKKTGKIENIGFSLYYPEELDYILDKKIRADIVQLPYSIFDQRFSKYFNRMQELNIQVHVRSLFLQGLVFKNSIEINGHLSGIKKLLENLSNLSKREGIPVIALCLSFAVQNNFVDKVVVGIDSIENLKEIFCSLNKFSIGDDVIKLLAGYGLKDEKILLPFLWEGQKN